MGKHMKRILALLLVLGLAANWLLPALAAGEETAGPEMPPAETGEEPPGEEAPPEEPEGPTEEADPTEPEASTGETAPAEEPEATPEEPETELPEETAPEDPTEEEGEKSPWTEESTEGESQIPDPIEPEEIPTGEEAQPMAETKNGFYLERYKSFTVSKGYWADGLPYMVLGQFFSAPNTPNPVYRWKNGNDLNKEPVVFHTVPQHRLVEYKNGVATGASRWAFCVVPHLHTKGGTAYLAKNPDGTPFNIKQFWNEDVSEITQIAIGVALANGYPNNPSITGSGADAAFATQLIIWELLADQRQNTGKFAIRDASENKNTRHWKDYSLRLIDYFPDYSTTKSVYQQIEQAMSHFSDRLSFAEQQKNDARTYEMTYDPASGLFSVDIPLTAEDLTMLESFDAPKVSGVTFTISSTKLRITATQQAAQKISDGENLFTYTNKYAKLYDETRDPLSFFGAAVDASTDPNYIQPMVTQLSNPVDPKPVYFRLKATLVEANIVKQAPEGGTKKATFRLYEGWTNYTADKYTTIQTDASGQSGTFSLKPGTSYYVEEVFEEGSPYDKDNSFQITGAAETKLTGTGHCGGKLHYFKANAGDKVTITCTNQWDMTLRIIKKSSQELVDAYASEGRTGNVNVGIDFLVWDSLAAYHTTMQDIYAPEVPVENGLTGNTEGYRVTTTEPKEPETEPPGQTDPQGLARR